MVFGGGAEAVTNLLGGHIDAVAVAVNNSIPHQKAGTLRILGVSTPRPDLGLDYPSWQTARASDNWEE